MKYLKLSSRKWDAAQYGPLAVTAAWGYCEPPGPLLGCGGGEGGAEEAEEKERKNRTSIAREVCLYRIAMPPLIANLHTISQTTVDHRGVPLS
jgi:hypothetical protein